MPKANDRIAPVNRPGPSVLWGWLLSRLGTLNRVTALAIVLTVAGWSLIWARALLITEAVPLWLGSILFVCGLALIPFMPDP